MLEMDLQAQSGAFGKPKPRKKILMTTHNRMMMKRMKRHSVGGIVSGRTVSDRRRDGDFRDK
jgi:hypothetical protein